MLPFFWLFIHLFLVMILLLTPYYSFIHSPLLLSFLGGGILAFFWLKTARFIRNTSATKGNAIMEKRNAWVTEKVRRVTSCFKNVTFTPLKPLLYKGVTFRYVFSLKSALFGVLFLGFSSHFRIIFLFTKNLAL